MNSEYIISDFAEYNPGLMVPKIHASRFDDKGGNRFYFFNDGTETRSAIGITTLLSKVMPESIWLLEWKLKYGKDWQEVLNLTAEYGTMMHACIAHMLINREMPPVEMVDDAKRYIKQLQRFDRSIPSNMIEKNLISFRKFMEDYNIEPLLIEALLVYKTEEGEYYCMTEDLLCKANYTKKWKEMEQVGEYVKGEKKGQPKYENVEKSEEVSEIWCVDFKSNPFNKADKGFYDSHLYQLIATKKAVEQNFDITPSKILNWSPLPWKSKEKLGAYTLKEWNIQQKDVEVLDLYEKLAHRLNFFRPSGQVEEINLQADSLEGMYTNYSYIEYVSSLEELGNG
jgi:hypothetical protein